jgi:FtsZ-interacting cell division protein ZipA
MLNLAEILTVIIGLLLALVFVDGIRRSVKTRKNKLKVDLVQRSAPETEEFEDISGPTVDETKFFDELEDSVEDIPVLKGHSLIIFNLCSKDNETFSYTTLSKSLSSYSFLFEDKGFFTFRDNTEEILFSLINAKKPGNFLEEKTSSDIALVLDPSKTPKVVESFDLMFSVAKSLSEDFSCSLLDENRNLLTKQMLDHMRDESQEFQRQRLANVS